MDATARLRHIVERARDLPLYRERLRAVAAADVRPDDLSALAPVTRDELTEQFRGRADGGFLREDVVQMHLTPAPELGRMPEFLTANDVRWQADAAAAQLRAAGVRAGDRAMVVFSYHMVAGGWLFHEGLTRLGALVLPLGPGDADQAAEIAERHGLNVLVSNPSFARRIGEAGGRFERLIAAGEPFTAVPGLRRAVERALGDCVALDAYGLSETGVVAAESEAQDGLWPVHEAALLEVLDPDGCDPVADGEKGELVITSLTHEAMPMLRFRTGDLTLKGSVDDRLHLPRGVFGRTDAMVKLKGIKVYPKELLFLLAGTPGVRFRAYQLRLRSNPDGTDHATLRVEADPEASVPADVGALGTRLRSALGVRLDAIEVLPEVRGPLLTDERYDGA